VSVGPAWVNSTRSGRVGCPIERDPYASSDANRNSIAAGSYARPPSVRTRNVASGGTTSSSMEMPSCMSAMNRAVSWSASPTEAQLAAAYSMTSKSPGSSQRAA